VQQQLGAPSGNDSAVSATTDSMHSAQRTLSGKGESMVDTEKLLERGNPGLHLTAQGTEQTPVPEALPVMPMHGSNVSTQQPGQQPAGKKLSLRERMRLLKGSQ
jgi:hypothetical protein